MKRDARGSGDAVLVVDVLSDFRFIGGDVLLRRFRPRIAPIASLLARARAAAVPVIYANDNFGRWRSSLVDVADRLRASDPVVWRTLAPIRPQPSDYVVLKPRHSAFYGTPLDFLLEELGVEQVIIAGIAADNCVFATAQDAYVRKFDVRVPRDCIAGESAQVEQAALAHMRRTLKADTRPSRTSP